MVARDADVNDQYGDTDAAEAVDGPPRQLTGDGVGVVYVVAAPEHSALATSTIPVFITIKEEC